MTPCIHGSYDFELCRRCARSGELTRCKACKTWHYKSIKHTCVRGGE